MQKKILIGDDHPLIRNGLELLIRSLGYSDIKGVASCGEIMNQLAQKKYTHCILDIKLTDGLVLEIMHNINKLYPTLKIAIFSMNPPEIFRQSFRQFGVTYYIPKTSKDEETNTMISNFLNDEPILLQDLRDVPPNPFSKLSEREHEVLHYVLNGEGTNSIANRLNIMPQSVSTLKNRIFEKTGAQNEKDLSRLASMYNIS